jgi:hypothetical protein
VAVDVSDTGGATWSATPGGELPGIAVPEVRVTVTMRSEGDIDVRSLSTVIAAVTPAHDPHRLEIRRADAASEAAG